MNVGTEPTVSIHAYSPPLRTMNFYCWLPSGMHHLREITCDTPEPDTTALAWTFDLLLRNPAPLARLRADGSLDPAFGNGGRLVYGRGEATFFRSVAVAPGGDVVGHLRPDIGAELASWMLEGGRCHASVTRIGTGDVASWRRAPVLLTT